jgi:hypothetical protein
MNARRSEFEDFNNRMGLTMHNAWLAESPQGPVAIVVHDGPGSASFMEKMASSDHPFDTWFRDSVSELHGIDFAQGMPGPMPEAVLTWSQQTAKV